MRRALAIAGFAGAAIALMWVRAGGGLVLALSAFTLVRAALLVLASLALLRGHPRARLVAAAWAALALVDSGIALALGAAPLAVALGALPPLAVLGYVGCRARLAR